MHHPFRDIPLTTRDPEAVLKTAHHVYLQLLISLERFAATMLIHPVNPTSLHSWVSLQGCICLNLHHPSTFYYVFMRTGDTGVQVIEFFFSFLGQVSLHRFIPNSYFDKRKKKLNIYRSLKMFLAFVICFSCYYFQNSIERWNSIKRIFNRGWFYL